MGREKDRPGFRHVDSNPVVTATQELRSIAGRLHLMGYAILVVTLLNIGALLWGMGEDTYSSLRGYPGSLAATNIIIAMASIAGLGLFEALRKRGDAIFQELSDELQWYVGRSWSDSRPSADSPVDRPILEARVTLRMFSASAELPLVPGRLGGAAYAFLNLMIAVSAVLLLGH